MYKLWRRVQGYTNAGSLPGEGPEPAPEAAPVWFQRRVKIEHRLGFRCGLTPMLLLLPRFKLRRLLGPATRAPLPKAHISHLGSGPRGTLPIAPRER